MENILHELENIKKLDDGQFRDNVLVSTGKMFELDYIIRSLEEILTNLY